MGFKALLVLTHGFLWLVALLMVWDAVRLSVFLVIPAAVCVILQVISTLVLFVWRRSNGNGR